MFKMHIQEVCFDILDILVTIFQENYNLIEAKNIKYFLDN